VERVREVLGLTLEEKSTGESLAPTACARGRTRCPAVRK